VSCHLLSGCRPVVMAGPGRPRYGRGHTDQRVLGRGLHRNPPASCRPHREPRSTARNDCLSRSTSMWRRSDLNRSVFLDLAAVRTRGWRAAARKEATHYQRPVREDGSECSTAGMARDPDPVSGTSFALRVPLGPLDAADRMSAVQIETSTQDRSGPARTVSATAIARAGSSIICGLP
jgi:hypothetical protein